VSPGVKTILQYIVIFSITILLVWFSLRGLQQVDTGDPSENSWDKLVSAWQQADKWWLMAMALIAFASHFLRAQRWKMLIAPSGYHVSLSSSFYSLMVGYLVNLAIPRGGEVSRCYNLYKLDKTPVEISFGTVVTERIVDVICLLILVAVAFVQESKKLLAFIDSLPISFDNKGFSVLTVLIVLAILLVVTVVLFLLLRKHSRIREFIVRTFAGFREGLMTVFRLRSPGLFVLYSLLIWALYFVMTYTVVKAFPSTTTLGFDAVLSLFAIGAIAMAAPLPGGAGSYHVLVPQGLILLYNIPQSDAVAFTFIFHGWQTFIMIIGGAISLLVTTIIVKRKR
jgi:glycosyltransferase 2 family protein